VADALTIGIFGCHDDAAGMTVEDVEVQGGDERVAQRVLLIEEGGPGAGLRVVPRTPLVDHQADLLAAARTRPGRGRPLALGLAHDLVVLRDQLVHEQGALQRREPRVLTEAGRRALLPPQLPVGSVS
jgi:hypothetical protein